jgi:hypothetical protein
MNVATTSQIDRIQKTLFERVAFFCQLVFNIDIK